MEKISNDTSTKMSPGRRDVLRLMGIGAAVGAVGFTIEEGALLTKAAMASAGRKIYVRADAGTGPDHDGSSPERAFNTLQAASNVTEPGDTVLIMNGTYIDDGAPGNQGTLIITRSGTAGQPITYTAFPNHTPVITVTRNSWTGIRITSASYITIENLTLSGLSAGLKYEDAYELRLKATPTYNANGIAIQPAAGNAGGAGSHHITVRNNLVHHWPGGGIAATKADYLTVHGNTVHSNAWYSIFANSGISTLVPSNFDSSTGYKHIFTNNLVYDNQSFIPWRQQGKISDGNGIIVDSTLGTEAGGTRYKGRTLVANNIVINNGGSGIHSYKANGVDIINNTAYLNAASPALDYGNIGAWVSEDCNVLNNISYVRTGKSTNSAYKNINVLYDHNIYYNGRAPEVVGPNDLIADPQFVSPALTPADADFRLQDGSPAIGSGTKNLAPKDDFTGKTRPPGRGIDRGAYRANGYGS
ncbi:right-handed parallel beta-helix repeat-containing protein [Paenarthrobacter sp. OM7]|uniref:right-handed parallel beta-helix repeat-containing protein n=1 Tax=Paenarthrobacter sp. OM7 TaxID=3041264 RepID=UPI0024685DAA|nr:right-handed parallel beta-helix repeat-containing protein [Paenarthrobacter sp. OM7]WGM20271.1 right-handed parallel beta-helix repeat-containing protein [Paenarthrobacter sp. OM7]